MGVNIMNELLAWSIALVIIFLLANSNIADGLFDALDLGDNLRRVVDWARGVRGFPAAVLAGCFLLLTLAFGALAWRYDLLPTYRFIQPVIRDVLFLSNEELFSILVVAVLALVPTLIEFATGVLIRREIKTLEFLAYFFVFFDIVTDFTEAASLVDEWQRLGLFAPLPSFIARVAEVFAKVSWTFAASFVFEFLTILFGAAFLLLLANVKAGGGGGR